LRTVKKWLAKSGLLLGTLGQPSLALAEFATALRDVIDPRQRCSPPFTRQEDGAVYTRRVAAWIKSSDKADKLPTLKQERSIQDKKHGYKLLTKQRRARQARQRLKEQRERSHSDALVRYEERLAGEWPIIKR